MKHLGPDEIDRIDELGRAVVAGDTDDDLFGPLVHEIAAALDVSECSIYTYQPIDQTVRAVAIWRRDPEVSEAAPGVVQSLRSRWDFAAVLAQNTTAETRADGEALLPSDRQRMAAAGELAALTAPLAVGDEVVGLIHAVERRRPRRFTAAERALFDAFGEAAAMAIHADALNRRLEVQNAQLELRLRERDRLTDELKDLSLRDEMTGLLNRRGFFTVAAQQFKLARRIGHRCMVAFVDVDGMKKLNDTWDTAPAIRRSRSPAGSFARRSGRRTSSPASAATSSWCSWSRAATRRRRSRPSGSNALLANGGARARRRGRPSST